MIGTAEVATSPKPAHGGVAKAVLRKAFSFPVFLGALLVAGVFGRAYQQLSPTDSTKYATSIKHDMPNIAVFEGDTWHHILVGEDILRTHTFPTTDSYTFTAYGDESMAFEWVGQVLMALTARFWGLQGLTALAILATAALMLLLYYYTSLRCGNSKAAFVASAPMMLAIMFFFSLRPQLFGYMFLYVTMILLEHFRRGRVWALWLLPPLFVVWANTHGSFVLGLFVLGLYWASGLVRFQAGRLKAEPWTLSQRLHLEIVFLLCVLALTVTPYGARLVGFTLHVLLDAKLGMSYVSEYVPLGGGPLMPFVVLLLAFLVAQVVLQPKYRLDELGLLVVAVYGTFAHSRLLMFWVPVFTPLLAVLLAGWIPRYDRAKDKYFLNGFLMALAALALVKFFPSRQRLETVVAEAFPQGAVEYLKRHPVRANMYNPDFWGAYLIRSLGHEHKIFSDGRSQLFEDAGVFEDSIRIGVDPDTKFLLRKYRVEACLTYRWGVFATYLSASPDWELAFSNNLSSLFLLKQSARPHTEP